MLNCISFFHFYTHCVDHLYILNTYHLGMAITCTKLAKLKRLFKEKMINVIKLSYLKLNKKIGLFCHLPSFLIRDRGGGKNGRWLTQLPGGLFQVSDLITCWHFSSVSVLVYQNHFLMISSFFRSGMNFYILKFLSIDQDWRT